MLMITTSYNKTIMAIIIVEMVWEVLILTRLKVKKPNLAIIRAKCQILFYHRVQSWDRVQGQRLAKV